MNPELTRTAVKLQADVEKVCAAYRECEKVFNDTIKHYAGTGARLQFWAKIPWSLWADLKFGGDWKKYEKYVHAAVDEYVGERDPKDKSQLWMNKTPDQLDPNPEVDRILDRIDVALHVLTQELKIDLPVKTVRSLSFEEVEHLRRLSSFVQGLNDVLDPDGKHKLAAKY